MIDKFDKIKLDSIFIERVPLPEGKTGWVLTGSVSWKDRPRDRKCTYDQNTRGTHFPVTREDLGQQSREELRHLLKTTKPFQPATGRVAWIFQYDNGQWYEPEY